MRVNHELVSKSSLRDLRGKPVLDFFPFLCSLRSEIAGMRFDSYKPAPGLGERLGNLLTSKEQELRAAAMALRDSSGIPFWDALLAVSMQQGVISGQFIETALAHDPSPDERETVLRSEEITVGRIADVISKLPAGYGLAACSRITLTAKRTAHIPMLDFRCPCREENAKAIEKMLALAGVREGILVESGRSYHFYGTSLLSEAAWVDFLGRALLFAPIVDSRFIGHRLVDGQCRLKIKDPQNEYVPRIADVMPSDL